MKKKYIIPVVIVILVILIILVLMPKDSSLDQNKKEETIIDDTVNLDNGDEKIDWDSLTSQELSLDNKSVEIKEEGTYTLTGTITGGSIIVNTDGDVKLILDNVDITNNSGPAIIIESANNTVIELKEGSVNTLVDGKNYSNTEYDGCIFSRDDLIFQGTGTLNITSNYLDGIVSNDDLKIISGTYIINSSDDAIRGKDSVYILNGDFTINSDADGIKSTNDTDTEKGYINIENGIFNIDSGEDAFQAETKLIIYDGTFNIKTSDGSGSTSSAIYNSFNGGSYDSTSSKAFKSVDNLIIKGGTFDINSKDDSIHSNNYISIENGTITISSGDDGIHADEEIVISNGTIKINNSYEGIEANDITINNGNINIVSSDDGINVSGGNDSSSMNRPGANMMANGTGTLTINGGYIYVNATGDGLDANGSITINDGKVYVDGPTNSGNGALDYDTTFNINGGLFIAVGSSGMAQSASSFSTQNSIMFNLSSSYKEKTIVVVDSNGNEIINYTPRKTYQNIVLSTPNLIKGSTYTLEIDGEEITTVTINSNVTTSGNNSNNPGGMGQKPGVGRR